MSSKARVDGLEPIETASRDELSAIQLERLKWSVKHAYENVAHYREKCQAKSVHPDDLRDARGSVQLPVHHKAGPARQLPVRPVRGAERSAWRASTPRAAPPASRRSSATRGATSTPGPTWSRARSAPPAAVRATWCHVAYGYGLFTGGLGAHYGAERLGCTVIPMCGGQTEKQVQLIQDFKPRHHHGDAVLHAEHRRGDASARASTRGRRRSRSASSAPSRGPRRCATTIESQARHRRGRHLRPVRGDGPGRRQRVRRDQGRPDHLGGSLLSRRSSIPRPARCCPTARRASWCSPRSPRKRCR